MKKIIIIGSGPAGISAALYAVRGGLDVTVIYDGDGALSKAHKIENYYGIKEISGVALLEEGRKQAVDLGAKLIKDQVVGLSFEDTLVVNCTNGNYPADAIIMATGAERGTPPIEGLKLLEGKGVSYCAVCDGFFFRNKIVGVIGNSQYAFHEAEVLKPLAEKVFILTNGKELEGTPPELFVVDKRKIKQLHAHPITDQNPVGTLRSVEFDDGEHLHLDGAFVAVGVAGTAELVRKLGGIVEGNKVIVDEHMATNLPGIYAAGDCTGGLLQISKAVYEGAQAAMSAIKYLKSI